LGIKVVYDNDKPYKVLAVDATDTQSPPGKSMTFTVRVDKSPSIFDDVGDANERYLLQRIVLTLIILLSSTHLLISDVRTVLSDSEAPADIVFEIVSDDDGALVTLLPKL